MARKRPAPGASKHNRGGDLALGVGQREPDNTKFSDPPAQFPDGARTLRQLCRSRKWEITVLRKADSFPLTKRITLMPDGSLRSDGRACVMSRGIAWRFGFNCIEELAELIEHFGPDQALALGALRSDLPAQVEVTAKRKLNGVTYPNMIARTRDYFTYRSRESALALVDYDTKGMPQSVADNISQLGGFWPALVSVLPALADVARVERKSTSAGLFRNDNSEQLPSSGGVHVFLAVKDGADVERFLRALHARCWLGGLGWYIVSAGGQLLERSIVDRVVGSPERLVFEGAPVLDPPLAQDKASRRPIATAGTLLDTLATCPDLSIVEQAKLKGLHAKEADRLASQATAVRRAYVAEHAKELAARTGLGLRQAAAVIENQCDGVLLPDVVLPFDDADLVDSTVGDVLADPDRFVDATLADPLEGVEYGAGKAKIMRRADGTPWIHSFAHGRITYELRYNFATAEAAIKSAKPEEAANIFVRCILALGRMPDPENIERLRNLACKISGIGIRTLNAMVKQAREQAALQQREEARAKRLAERRDPRPAIRLPFDNDEWLPQMDAINEVLGAATDSAPPARDRENDAAAVRTRVLLSLHLLTTEESNYDHEA